MSSIQLKFLEKLTSDFTTVFHKISRGYLFFHLFFGIGLFLELMIFTLFFSQLMQTAAVAFFLAAIFLTLFTYLVLFFYLQARKIDKLLHLRDAFLVSCKPHIEEGGELANAAQFFSEKLFINEVHLPFFGSGGEPLQKFQIWTKWQDLLKMKELLLLAAAKEQIEEIKKEPSSVEAHAKLADSYLTLARLYEDPETLVQEGKLPWVPPEYGSEKMQVKVKKALLRSLEELQIIEAYAPHDPWIYTKRAAIYERLRDVDKEIAEYENLLRVAPENSAILLKLGRLYFKQGKTALGLKIYDQLKEEGRMGEAEELISHYGAYASIE